MQKSIGTLLTALQFCLNQSPTGRLARDGAEGRAVGRLNFIQTMILLDNKLGYLEEMSLSEMSEVNGGAVSVCTSPWKIVKWVAEKAAETCAGNCASSAVTGFFGELFK